MRTRKATLSVRVAIYKFTSILYCVNYWHEKTTNGSIAIRINRKGTQISTKIHEKWRKNKIEQRNRSHLWNHGERASSVSPLHGRNRSPWRRLCGDYGHAKCNRIIVQARGKWIPLFMPAPVCIFIYCNEFDAIMKNKNEMTTARFWWDEWFFAFRLNPMTNARSVCAKNASRWWLTSLCIKER